jgi:DNA-binding protein H-NS
MRRIPTSLIAMSRLNELITQRELLDQEIATLQKEERGNAISQARELIELFNLSEDELFGRAKSTRTPVAAKYRNPETGETWTGRGRAPRWMDGRSKDEFLI